MVDFRDGGGEKVEVGRILSRSRRAVKFRPLNGHSSRVRGKTWLSPLVVPSSCAFHPAAAAAAAAAAGGGGGRGEAGTKVLGAKRWVVAEEGENKGSGAEYFNIYHGEIGTRVCRGSLLPRHFPPPPCSSSTPRLANRRLRCPTARSDSPLSTPPPSSSPATCLSVLLTTPVTQCTARMNSDRTRRDTPLPRLRPSTQIPTISMETPRVRVLVIHGRGAAAASSPRTADTRPHTWPNQPTPCTYPTTPWRIRPCRRTENRRLRFWARR